MKTIPEKDDEGEYTDEFRASLLRSLNDRKYGKVHSMEGVKKILNKKK